VTCLHPLVDATSGPVHPCPKTLAVLGATASNPAQQCRGCACFRRIGEGDGGADPADSTGGCADAGGPVCYVQITGDG